MVAVDTNVLVRFLVLLETEWVLRGLYGLSSESVAAALEGLAGLRTVLLEDELAKRLTALETISI